MARLDGADFKVNTAVASVRRQVEDQLRRAIVRGHFTPGTHLPDRLLQDTFQVSRPVVREAVRQLEAEGLIETLPNRGSFVRRLTVREAEQVYAVRSVLEGLAAKEFARNATDDEVEAIDRVLRRIRKQQPRRGKGELIDLKQEFYEVLLAGCRNSYVRSMLGTLLNINAQLRATSLSAPGRLPGTIAELEAIVAALRARDGEAAARACSRHVENAAAIALHLLRERSAGKDDA